MRHLQGILKDKPFSQHLIVLFILMIAGSVMAVLTGRMLMYLFYGIDIAASQALENIDDVQTQYTYRWLLLINHLGMLVLPVVIWSWLCGDKQQQTLCLHKSVFIKPLIWCSLVFIFSLPMANLLLDINLRLPLPDEFLFMEQINTENTKLSAALIYNDSFSVFVINVFVFALMPAISEELMFRTFLQNKLTEIFKNKHTAVFVAAVVFSFFHLEIYYFLPRLFLGLLLGYLFLYSGNIKYSIWAHFINNFLSLSLAFLAASGQIDSTIEYFGANNSAEVIISITGCLLGAACILKFKKSLY
jgi:membrane protease YdiL (CAAX protease family)